MARNIYVAADDELTFIVEALTKVVTEDIVEDAATTSIVIHFARNAQAGHSPMNFTLIEAAAKKLGVSLVISTSDTNIYKTAKASGLSVRKATDESIIKHSARTRAPRASSRKQKRSKRAAEMPSGAANDSAAVAQSVDQEDDERVPLHVTKQEEKSARKREKQAYKTAANEPRHAAAKRRTTWKITSLLVAATAIVGLLLAWIFIPAATVVIRPPSIDLALSEPVTLYTATASAPPSDAANSIPAHKAGLSFTTDPITVDATGRTDVNGAYAEGTIRITNAYSTRPQPLIATTRFVTEDGTLFRLLETVTVPGMTRGTNGELQPATIDVRVRADQPGSDGNKAPTTFTIPGLNEAARAAITGESADAFRGGIDPGAGQAVITQQDRDQAVERILQDAQDRAQQELKAYIPQGYELVPGLMAVTPREIISVGDVGDVQDSFVLSVTVDVEAVAIESQGLEAFMQSQLRPLYQEQGGLLVDDVAHDAFLYRSQDLVWSVAGATDTDISTLVTLADETWNVELAFRGAVFPPVSIAALQDALQGRTIEEARALVQEQGGEVIRIETRPQWITSLPRRAAAVRISLDTGE